MYIKGNAFELRGREFLDDIEKYETIVKYIDAYIEDQNKDYFKGYNLKFQARIFCVKVDGKRYYINRDGDIIAEEELSELKKQLRKLHSPFNRIASPMNLITIDCFEQELSIEVVKA